MQLPAKLIFVAAVIGFVNESYTRTERDNLDIGVMSYTELGQEVVVVLSTQSDSAEGGR